MNKETKDQIAREAERQYPKEIVIGNPSKETYTYNQISNIERRAYIAGAETWAERGEAEIDRLTDENNRLSAENHTLSEELGELKEIDRVTDARITQEQQKLLIAYRDKIAMSKGITVETILAMLEDDIKTLRTIGGDQLIKNILKSSNDTP